MACPIENWMERMTEVLRRTGNERAEFLAREREALLSRLAELDDGALRDREANLAVRQQTLETRKAELQARITRRREEIEAATRRTFAECADLLPRHDAARHREALAAAEALIGPAAAALSPAELAAELGRRKDAINRTREEMRQVVEEAAALMRDAEGTIAQVRDAEDRLATEEERNRRRRERLITGRHAVAPSVTDGICGLGPTALRDLADQLRQAAEDAAMEAELASTLSMTETLDCAP